MKRSPTHDAELEPRRNIIETDGTLTDVFLEYIKKKMKLPHTSKMGSSILIDEDVNRRRRDIVKKADISRIYVGTALLALKKWTLSYSWPEVAQALGYCYKMS